MGIENTPKESDKTLQLMHDVIKRSLEHVRDLVVQITAISAHCRIKDFFLQKFSAAIPADKIPLVGTESPLEETRSP